MEQPSVIFDVDGDKPITTTGVTIRFEGGVQGEAVAVEGGKVDFRVYCDDDHCTPEERAVIDAAIADHEAISAGTGTNADIDKVVAARGALTVAIARLVAARRKT